MWHVTRRQLYSLFKVPQPHRYEKAFQKRAQSFNNMLAVKNRLRTRTHVLKIDASPCPVPSFASILWSTMQDPPCRPCKPCTGHYINPDCCDQSGVDKFTCSPGAFQLSIWSGENMSCGGSQTCWWEKPFVYSKEMGLMWFVCFIQNTCRDTVELGTCPTPGGSCTCSGNYQN